MRHFGLAPQSIESPQGARGMTARRRQQRVELVPTVLIIAVIAAAFAILWWLR